MYARDLLVALKGRGLHGVAYGVRKPAVQVLPHLQVVRVEDESAICVSHRLPQDLPRFRLGVCGHVAAPAVGCEVGAPVASDLPFIRMSDKEMAPAVLVPPRSPAHKE